MNTGKIIVLAVYIITCLITAALASDLYPIDKRAQDRPFMMSSRYGRSGAGVARGAVGKHVVVAPRTDKFFLASRYGKRSGVLANSLTTYPTDSLPPLCGIDEDLSCAYTGFSNLYRCAQRQETTNNEGSVMN